MHCPAADACTRTDICRLAGSVVLDGCAEAVLAAGGREVWQLQANGQLANAATKLCAGLAADDPDQGGRVALMDCDAALKINDGRSQWEMLGSGQWKLAAGSDLCLSQSGAAPGLVNAAARMAARASSTASPAHGAMPSARGAAGPARVVRVRGCAGGSGA